MTPIRIAPSLLSADFGDLKNEIARVDEGGCDMLHVDVMDGHFVPNITVGPFIVKAIRQLTRLPLDVHLMIENPWDYIPQFVKAGADHITVHAEACPGNLGDVLQQLKDEGVGRGVSVRPQTPLDPIREHLDQIDMVLLMTVNPGFGGQAFMPEVLPKVAELRKIYDKDIEVDGGITPETAVAAVQHGANVLVAGTAIFKADDPAKVIRQLKGTSKQRT